MPVDNRNIYQVARRAAGLTQEKAAELMGVPDRSLRAYEVGERVPPNEVVEAMCVCYNAQHLAYQHLHQTNALAGRLLPDLKQRSLLELAVKIYNRMARFQGNDRAKRLLEIVDDGRITEDEQDDLDLIMADMQEIIQTGLELKIYCEENGGEEAHHD